jgi:hypothetical protein
MRDGNQRWIGYGLLAVAFIGLILIFSSRGSQLSYRANPADTAEGIAASVNPYDELDRSLDHISASLAEANRNAQVRRLGKRYLDLSLEVCRSGEYLCQAGEVQFLDSHGCGCMPPPAEEEVTSTDSTTSTVADESVRQSAGEVVLGQATRLQLGETWAIGRSGDALWLEEFLPGVGGAAPTMQYRIFIAADDQAYIWPSQAEQIFYSLEEVATDYDTFVEVIVTTRGNAAAEIVEEVVSE